MECPEGFRLALFADGLNVMRTHIKNAIKVTFNEVSRLKPHLAKLSGVYEYYDSDHEIFRYQAQWGALCIDIDVPKKEMLVKSATEIVETRLLPPLEGCLLQEEKSQKQASKAPEALTDRELDFFDRCVLFFMESEYREDFLDASTQRDPVKSACNVALDAVRYRRDLIARYEAGKLNDPEEKEKHEPLEQPGT